MCLFQKAGQTVFRILNYKDKGSRKVPPLEIEQYTWDIKKEELLGYIVEG